MKQAGPFTASLLAIAIFLSAATGVGAASEHWTDASAGGAQTATHIADDTAFTDWVEHWDQTRQNYELAALTPGADESEMNFGWYSRQGGFAAVRIARTQDMRGSAVYTGSSAAAAEIDGVPYCANKVTVKNLIPGAAYYYQVNLNGVWQPAERLQTADPSAGFSFLYVGDPQIGASESRIPADCNGGKAQTTEIAARNDSFNWAVTLNTALADNPDVAFLLCAGDQINTPARGATAEELLQQECEYAGFLSPIALRSLPVAATVGNHDAATAAFQNHFNNPNPYGGSGGTAAGNGHYFAFGNTLFIALNTNNYNCAEHRDLLAQAVRSHPDATWRIVAIHQDIYGTGLDHSDSDGIILRTQLTPLFDEFGVDVVLQGHDHSYSRSHHLTGDGGVHGAYGPDAVFDEAFQVDNLCYKITSGGENPAVNPTGTLYLSANSATGSKYGELIPARQDYIALRSQTWTPTYSVIGVDGNSLTLRTCDVLSGNTIDSYTVLKTAHGE